VIDLYTSQIGIFYGEKIIIIKLIKLYLYLNNYENCSIKIKITYFMIFINLFIIIIIKITKIH